MRKTVESTHETEVWDLSGEVKSSFPSIRVGGEKKVRDGARLLARKEREHYPELRKNENNFSHSRKAFFSSPLSPVLSLLFSRFSSPSLPTMRVHFERLWKKLQGGVSFTWNFHKNTQKSGESFDRTRTRHVELKLMVELSTNDFIIWAETLHFSPLLPSPSNSRFIWCLFRRGRSETGKGGKMVWNLADVNELGRRSKKRIVETFPLKSRCYGLSCRRCRGW